MSEILEILSLPFLACLLMGSVLGYFGIHVLKREVIFVDISLAQIAAVGSILAHMLFKVHGNSLLAYGLAVFFVILVGCFYALARRRVTQISLEAIIGVTYAIAAAAALFLVGIAPGGHLHVQRMLAGTLLWVSPSDIIQSAVIFTAVCLCFYIWRKPLTAITEVYQETTNESRHAIGWDSLFYALLGIVIISSVKMAGVVVVFAYLIIPATIALLFTRRTAGQLLIIWSMAFLASIAGLLFSYFFDFSVGPSIGAFMGGQVIIAGIISKLFLK
ncbi:MAG: metal ABC transporter permease [Sedimentisphaerales bacterium]|nr:metal ABC transporter permease [Sedimentisphaerales bacterium]